MTGGIDGRGRLSSIELLPDDCEPDIVWANEQLRDRTMPSIAILAEFNARLADRGVSGVSKSAWGRYSVRKAIQFRKLDDKRRMSAELIAQLGPNAADDVTVMVAELIKVSMFDLLEGGELSAKGVMELSRALQATVSAQRGSEEYRRKLEQRVAAEMNRAADAVNAVGKKNGVAPDTLKKITSLLTTGTF